MENIFTQQRTHLFQLLMQLPESQYSGEVNFTWQAQVLSEAPPFSLLSPPGVYLCREPGDSPKYHLVCPKRQTKKSNSLVVLPIGNTQTRLNLKKFNIYWRIQLIQTSFYNGTKMKENQYQQGVTNIIFHMFYSNKDIFCYDESTQILNLVKNN